MKLFDNYPNLFGPGEPTKRLESLLEVYQREPKIFVNMKKRATPNSGMWVLTTKHEIFLDEIGSPLVYAENKGLVEIKNPYIMAVEKFASLQTIVEKHTFIKNAPLPPSETDERSLIIWELYKQYEPKKAETFAFTRNITR